MQIRSVSPAFGPGTGTEILVWIQIRIRGSVPLTQTSGFGSGPDPAILSVIFKMATQKFFYLSFFGFLVFEATFTSFFKEVTEQYLR